MAFPRALRIRITPWSRAGGLLGLVLLYACQLAGVNPAPLAGSRVVLAGRDVGNHVVVSMSTEGTVWTDPLPVAVNGVAQTAASTPQITHDGALYHLVWVAPGGDVQYATSRAGNSWLVQSTPLTRLSAGLDPTFAVGPEGVVGAWRGGVDVIVANLANIPGRQTVAQEAGTAPSLVRGNGQYVLAYIAQQQLPGAAIRVLRSPDGNSWTSAASVPLPRGYWADLSFAEGVFVVAAKVQVGQLAVNCVVLTSPDAITWSRSPNIGCSNSSTGLGATRLDGADLAFENWDNRFLQISRSHTRMTPASLVQLRNDFTLAVGPGPQLAAVRLDNLTVVDGDGQDLTLMVWGFHVRVNEPGTASATFGSLDEFATDVDRPATVSVPGYVSAPGWLIGPALNVVDDATGKLDVAGALIVGLERGNCPSSRILATAEAVRTALAAQLETRIAQGTLAVLRDTAQRRMTFEAIANDIKSQLGGTTSGIARAFGCAFNEDEQLKERTVTLVGTYLVDDEPTAPTFALKSDRFTTPFRVRLVNDDGDIRWDVNGAVFFRGTP